MDNSIPNLRCGEDPRVFPEQWNLQNGQLPSDGPGSWQTPALLNQSLQYNQITNGYNVYQQAMNGNVQDEQLARNNAIASILHQQAQANALYTGPVVGLQALCAACSRNYPDQSNPLQVTARIKYWLGGPDPLDYISMYWNTGRPDLNVPPHWHYVSFGLSDLHGDGRVHPPPPPGPLQEDQFSGLGLELSFRVLGDPGRPPTWPAALLQRLATYVFKTGNRLCVGDHVSWHSALDGSDQVPIPTQPLTQGKQNAPPGKLANENNNGKKKLKIRHMLMAQDLQLGTVDTPLGKVQFVQVVGVTDRELKAAQRSGGAPILEALAADSRCGGAWLVTDVERSQSASLPRTSHLPSDLSGVAAVCRWEPWLQPQSPSNDLSVNKHQTSNRECAEMSSTVKEQIRCVLQKGLSGISLSQSAAENSLPTKPESLNECKMSTDSAKFSLLEEEFKDNCRVKLENDKVSHAIHKDVAMSTDSFEMSKIENALIEDVIQNEASQMLKQESAVNGKNPVDVKVEVKSELTNDGTEKKPCKCDKSANNEGDSQYKNQGDESCNQCGSQDPWLQTSCALPRVHLVFDREAGGLLSLALSGRVLHGRHFTWTAVSGVQAITLVASAVSGANVNSENPIVATNNGWLQVLIPESFAKEMAMQLEVLAGNEVDDSDNEETTDTPAPPTPTTFEWLQRGLKISIVDNILES